MMHLRLITHHSCEWIRPFLTSIFYIVPWTHVSQSPNGISICSTIFVQYMSVTKTDRHTDCDMCDICRNRLHLCYACDVA